MIFKTVRNTVEKYKLLEKKDKILIAYSGGVDSTALLAVMLGLRKEWELELYLGHFNHRLRLQASTDEQFARNVAQENSLPLFVASEDVRSYAENRRLNLEEAARILRYDFLEKTAQKIGAAKIATGHTMDDQAETFFLRLMRGSGLRGLGGIFPVVEDKIIRPLLFVEREDIEKFLQKRGKEYRIDESNFDRRLARNKIRLELIPYLKKSFDARIVPRISRIVSILQPEEDLLERLASKEASRHLAKKEDSLCLNLRSATSLPLALARRIVRTFIAEVKGDVRGISFEDVERILNLKEGESLTIRENIVLKRDNDVVFPWQKSLPMKEYEYQWEGESPLEIEQLNLSIHLKKKTLTSSSQVFDDETRAVLDSEKIQFPLLVRNRREGDRYRPIGAPGRKKLKEIMRAKNIPINERDQRPVFISKGEIIWVLGLPVSEEVKIGAYTTELVVLTVSPLSPHK